MFLECGACLVLGFVAGKNWNKAGQAKVIYMDRPAVTGDSGTASGVDGDRTIMDCYKDVQATQLLATIHKDLIEAGKLKAWTRRQIYKYFNGGK